MHSSLLAYPFAHFLISCGSDLSNNAQLKGLIYSPAVRVGLNNIFNATGYLPTSRLIEM
ncbi:hypothetical protein M1146_03645 [Patescibacteria group bacterium]|nr:hypothetical protein [Patescibacteria group bacterium]